MTTRRMPLTDSIVRLALIALIGIDVIIGSVLRFKTNSLLWLDEAQSVNIAAHPLSQLTHFLREDGAPPLYYVMLHVWMGALGHSDFDVRAFSGAVSLLALVATYFAIRSWWGEQIAWLATAIVAVMPYCIYFGTETRMYALVMLLSTLLFWALRCYLLRPRILTALVIAFVATLLLYTHYWGLYLVGAMLAYSAVHWYRNRAVDAKSCWWLFGALASSYILWLPWLPIFNEQRLHTGTPWSAATSTYELFTWFDGFTVNQSVPHVANSLHSVLTVTLFVALIVVGALGFPMVRKTSTIVLDFLGRPSTRLVTFLILFTMAVGLLASHVSGSAFAPRYAAVIAIPLCALCAFGIQNLGTTLRIVIVLGLLSGACLWSDKWGIGVQRSQAGQVAAKLADAPSGSLVFVCPDQLGPSLLRYAKPTLTYLGYPRFTSPEIVNWYNYKDAYEIRTPAANAAIQSGRVGADQTVYIVRAVNYGLKGTCWGFTLTLAHDLGRKLSTLVRENIGGYYQSMELQVLPPNPS